MSSISCSTCLECFFPSSDVSTTPCGHLFHTKCIKRWFQANDTNTCPHCRNDVNSGLIHKVYFSAAEPDNDSAQKLLETIFNIAFSDENCHDEIIKMLEENVWLKTNKEELGNSKNNDFTSKCSTCLESFSPSSDVSITPCGHLFHSKCIQNHANNRNNCPHCRNDVKSDEIHKVYFSAAEPGNEKEENDSTQKLLETIFDIACSGANSSHGEIVKILKEIVCFQCKRPVKESEKCKTLQKVYHCKCQPYFVIKNPCTKMSLSIESNPNRR